MDPIPPPPTVLFLCTGNYYRSRFAELYFNHLAAAADLPWRAESRGLQLFCDNPGPISAHTLRRLADRGIPLPELHRAPLAVTEADLHRARRVIAMKEAEHRPLLERDFPAWPGRVEFWHVHDVDFSGPDLALPELEGRVEDLIRRLRAP